MGKPSAGVTFVTSIDRRSNSGNGMIIRPSNRINIGPVTRDATGSEVVITVTSTEAFAWCHTESVKPPDYRKQFRELISNRLASSRCAKCGKELTDSELWCCESCGEGPSDEFLEYSEHDLLDTESGEYDFSSEPETDDIDLLRKKAEEAAVTQTSVDQESSTITAQYNRSTAVSEYVKARAEGTCEGCGSPAPFRSKTGEPYLHAHHIHELSDGGSDTPDTVIALCPNCHYRVHHGEDGEEYNQELLEIIQEIERGE